MLSAPDEMEYAMSSSPQKPKFDPDLLAKIQFDDTTLQSSYAVLEVPCVFCILTQRTILRVWTKQWVYSKIIAKI